MLEDLEAYFHVSESHGVMQVTCLRCGKFVGASPRMGPLRTAVEAHNCGFHADPRRAGPRGADPCGPK